MKILISRIYNKSAISMDSDLYVSGFDVKELSDGLLSLKRLQNLTNPRFQIDMYGLSCSRIN